MIALWLSNLKQSTNLALAVDSEMNIYLIENGIYLYVSALTQYFIFLYFELTDNIQTCSSAEH